MSDDTIGGYFALELRTGTGLDWINEAIGYRSARSALAAVLAAAQPNEVWVPNYICGAVNDALRSIDLHVRRYALTESLGVPAQVSPAPNDLLICVDYFGISAPEVGRTIERFGMNRVIVDASQSLFHRHRPGCTTVYSPRKFFGVPDGGLVRTSRKLAPLLDAIDADSVARSQHLLYRLAGLIDVGYEKFQEAEESLSKCEPVSMSKLTKALLRSIDADAIATLRIRNYNHLAASLRAAGFDVPSLPSGAVPLCCPVRCNDAIRVRKELTAQHIYTPTYWRDATIPEYDHIAMKMRDRTVYLPCDQRYGDPELLRITDALIESMEAS